MNCEHSVPETQECPECGFGFIPGPPSVQPPCPCCVTYGPCYKPDNLPDNWRDIPEYAEQACYQEGCKCWGGPDHECEDCWLWLK